MFGLNYNEISILKKLNTPSKIQDFLNELDMNFEEDGDTCMSPKRVLRERKCHCIEGAMLAALALRINGYKSLLVDLTATKSDFDHVVAVFKKNKKWGAISKTNHGVLRYREPVYSSIKELVMSYFHEYTTNDGKKTLRSFSMPVNLSRFDSQHWITSEEDIWYIPEYLADVKHIKILTPSQIANLRNADEIEIKIGKIVERENPNAKEGL